MKKLRSDVMLHTHGLISVDHFMYHRLLYWLLPNLDADVPIVKTSALTKRTWWPRRRSSCTALSLKPSSSTSLHSNSGNYYLA